VRVSSDHGEGRDEANLTRNSSALSISILKMAAETIGVAIAAVSATASAASAYASRQSVDRAHRAFVWPAIAHELDAAGHHILSVTLHNDGAGSAYDVRWAVGSVTANEKGKIIDDESLTADTISVVTRALRPGETLPALKQAIALPEDDIWWVLVRWTDASRVRWQVGEQVPSRFLRADPRRLRTWRWQAWRPKRDW
jgi:hypothetical protein